MVEMRFPLTTRLLALTVGAWFGCVNCVVGCDMELLPTASTTTEAHHHGSHSGPVEQESDAHSCCEKPEGTTDPTEQPTPAGIKECCSKVTTAAVEKIKRPKAEPATDPVAVTAAGPGLSALPLVWLDTLTADSSGTYLRFRVLRI